MNTMYLSFGGNVSVCCSVDGKCYFFAQHDYEEHLLDLLYNYIISCGVERIRVLVQGEWATKPYSESYISGKLRISNAQFFGSINQVDVNKLVHLFKTANVEDYEFIDRFVIYEAIAKSEKQVCCLVDRSYASLMLLVVDYSASTDEFVKEIFYILPNSLGKYMTVLKRKYNNPKFIDVEHYVIDSSDKLENYSKFSAEQITFIGQLTVADYADDRFKLDKSKIAFSSSFNSYAIAEEEQIEAVPEGVTAMEEPVEEEKSVQKPKKKKGCLSVILSFLIILCMLSVVGVFLINKLIGGDIDGLKKKLENIQIEFSEKEQYNDMISASLDFDEAVTVYKDLKITEIPGIELARLDICRNSAAMNYFVKDDVQLDTLSDVVSRNYKIKTTSNLGDISQNGISYTQRYIEITY